jgi:hypothetical protein
MQPGQITGLIQIESAYTILRLNDHSLSLGSVSLEEVKADLKVELQKEKYEKLRSGLRQAAARQSQGRRSRLRSSASPSQAVKRSQLLDCQCHE